MKKKHFAAMAATFLALSGLNIVLADEHEAGMTVSPVETFTCSYNEGQGPADFAKVTADWNQWMDEQGHDSYGAMTLTPYYHGAETFDIGWLGFWTDGASMGAGTDAFLTNGGEVAAGFSEVVTCETHSNFASTMIKSPGDGEPPDNIVLYFSDCNLEDGAEWDAVFDGLRAWADYMTEQEYGNGLWVMFPAFGDGGMKYDFKSVTSYSNHTEAGKAWDKHGNGGGWQKRSELLGDLLSCDVSRVYNATFQRKLPPPEDG